MHNFIKSLGEAVGYYPMSTNTEIKVFDGGEEFEGLRVVIPACRNGNVEGGYPMTAKELEDCLSLYTANDLGGYESLVSVSDIEAVDDGVVLLYGVSVDAVC